MTVGEAITRVDNLKPNQYGTEDKVHWLATLDGKIVREVMAGHEGAEAVVEGFAGYDPATDLDKEMLVAEPYADLYLHHLMAQIDYHNAEMTRYNNSMVMFNMAFSAYAAWYNRTHMPLQQNHVRTSIAGDGVRRQAGWEV